MMGVSFRSALSFAWACAIVTLAAATFLLTWDGAPVTYSSPGVPPVRDTLVERSSITTAARQLLTSHSLFAPMTNGVGYESSTENESTPNEVIGPDSPILVGIVGGPPYGVILERLPGRAGGIVLFEDAPQDEIRILTWGVDSIVVQWQGAIYTLEVEAAEWRR